MRPIDIEGLISAYESIHGKDSFKQWEEEADKHLSNIKTKSKKERSKYFSTHNHWSKLYAALSALSFNKCWYSESPENSSEWEVEHFRPKGESKNEDGNIVLDEGYWWLAYYWRNFRFAGSLVNKLRNDRFEKGQTAYGKGNYFPLDLIHGKIAKVGDLDCLCEKPKLLDPINPRDTTFIGFDQDGEAYENVDKHIDPVNFERASLSIRFYGLDHMPIKNGRKQVIEICRREIEKAHRNCYNDAVDFYEKQNIMDNLYRELYDLSRPSKPYSSIVKHYIKLKRIDYPWLDDVLELCAK